ncbi:MAG: ribosome maturation factor RimP [Thermodesulfobacteriota bacterium]|nr:ribosome maturation factor RimP [Thermodesulfobacteriota bacterium]
MLKKVRFITKQVTDLVAPILEEMDFELIDVEYFSNQGRWVLRLFIDKDGGVTIDDCANVSGEIGDLIDLKGFIEHEYILEVSSPGLNRTLKKEKDFFWAVGKKVKVRMVSPLNNRRNFSGYLKNFNGRILYVEMDDGTAALPLKEVDRANLVYEF